jgi:flavin-dependent dehydrogenase
MTILQQSADCLVIGGGLAGSMAGLRLAAAGRDVTLVEREPGPKPKVCGEFLSAEAVGYLRQCGVDPIELGARQVRRLRFSASSRTIEAQLPFPALALSRSVLDEELLKRAEERGCRVMRGVAIEKLTRHGDAWCARAGDDGVFRAGHLFLASGKHDLRGWGRPAGAQNDLIGFKMHWRLAAKQAEALAGGIELIVFPGGYGGMVTVEDDSANLSLVVRREIFQSMHGWGDLLSHMRSASRLLDQRLRGAKPKWERPFAISSIPYGYLSHAADGCWRVGDQAAVIPSFTGDGMAIALHSAALAVETFLGGGAVEKYQDALASQLRRGMKIAIALSRLMASRTAQSLAPAAMAVLPLALTGIATRTRIPERALVPQAQRT